MGNEFIEPFKGDIDRFFFERNDDKGKKLSLTRMQEILILQNPMSYEKPAVLHITSVVQSVFQKMKKN